MFTCYKKAQQSMANLFGMIQGWVIPMPRNMECAYEVMGEQDGAGCQRNILLENVRSKAAFQSQITCEADIRKLFYPTIEKRLDVGIKRNGRRAYDIDDLEKVMPELTEQDIFDIWKLFVLFQRDPREMLTSRAELIITSGLLGFVGPIEEFLTFFAPEEDSYFTDTSNEGIDFQEFLHSFYKLVIVDSGSGHRSPLSVLFTDLFRETKIRKNMSSVQRVIARMN